MDIIADYKMLKDAELVAACRDRGIPAPLNEENRVMRPEAIRLLKEYDEQVALTDPKEYVTVVFHSSGNPSAGPYVYAAINDRNIQAPFEKKVRIPKYFLTECIDRAFTQKYRQVKQADGTHAYIPEKIQTYPYTIVSDDA